LEALDRHSNCWFDAAHPRRIGSIEFLLSGLSYGIGDKASGFVDSNLHAELLQKVYPDVGGQRQPPLSLFRDLTQAQNSLGSFLGSDRGEMLEPFIGTEAAALFSRPALQMLVTIRLQELAENKDSKLPWIWLGAILGDLPVYAELIDELVAALCKTDFVNIVREDHESQWPYYARRLFRQSTFMIKS